MTLALAWIPATMLAGLLQAWRTAVQQRLRAQLSINGAGIVRYVYGLPIVLLVLGAYLWATGATLPSGDATFFALAAGIVSALSDPGRRRAAAERNQTFVESYGVLETNLSRMEAWYYRLSGRVHEYEP